MSLGGPFPIGDDRQRGEVRPRQGRRRRSPPPATTGAAGSATRPRYPGVVAVAATQFDETTTFYSNWGAEIDIAAPGGNTRVDQNGDGKPDGVLQNTIVPGNISRTDYLWFMGTSMASPHVAGVAALIVGRGRHQARRRRGDPARHRAQAARARRRGRGRRGADRRPLRRRHRRRRRGPAQGARRPRRRRASALGAAFCAPGRWRCSAAGARLERLGLGFVAALVAGSSACSSSRCFAASWPRAHAVAVRALAGGVPRGLRRLGARQPAAPQRGRCRSRLIVLLYGVRRLRPALAGFAFGVAGALLFAAITGAVDVRFVPDVLDGSG